MDSSNRNTALASALVEELARCGVRNAVLSPGSRSTPLAIALWRQPAMSCTVLVDERSAGFFALGAAQESGRPVALLCTSGSAAANLHPAVVEADEAAVPLIVLTADRPPELRGIGAGQTIDQLKIYGSSVRWFCEVGIQEADDTGLIHFRSTACRAYAAARGEPRPGPVHLNIAWREPLAPIPVQDDLTAESQLALEGRGEMPLTAVNTSPPRADAALLDELAGRIASTPRGLILAGRQTNAGLAGPLTELARAAGYPLLAEPTSQLRVGPHDRGSLVWAYDPIARLRPGGLAPELIIRVGDAPTCKPLREWIGQLQPRQVVLDPVFGWNEPSRTAETVLRADIGDAAAGLANRIEAPADPSWAASWLETGAAAAAAVENELSRLEAATEPGLQAALGEIYADGDLVYTASSMPIRDQELFLPPGAADVRFLCNRGANGIDGIVSSAAGAAAASGRPAYVIVGDLGLFHDMNGLAALRDISTPVRVIAINNGGGAIFDFLPQAEVLDQAEFEALFNTPSGLEMAKIAALHGIEHRRVERLDQLSDALGSASVLVEVMVERKANVALHRRLAEAAASAVAPSR